MLDSPHGQPLLELLAQYYFGLVAAGKAVLTPAEVGTRKASIEVA